MPFNLLFRDDIFISYSRRDGGSYAAGLADELTRRKLSCFIDKLGTEPNEDLPESFKKKIRNCSLFVLVGTKQGAASEFVEREIVEFKKTRRTIVPIDFDGSVRGARWSHLIRGLPVQPEVKKEALKTGDPSPNVISWIEKSFNYTRRNRRMLWFLSGAIVIFFMLAIAILVAFFVAERSIVRAQVQSRIADEAQTRAQAETQTADAAQLRAAEQKRIAERAQEEAETQKKEATKAAEQARTAEYNASRAARREQIARASADEQQRIAETRLDLNNHLLYASAIKLARQEYEVGNLERGEELLESYLPKQKSQEAVGDYRGFEWYYLWRLYHRNIATLTGHQSDVTSIAFSPDGRMLATADSALTVKLWDTTSLQVLRASRPSRPVGSVVAFSPNGKILAAAGSGTVRLLDTTTYTELTSLEGLERSVTSIAFSPDGKLLAAVVEKDAVRLWDTITFKEINTIKGHDDYVTCIAFSPDGKLLVTGSNDATVRVWDTASYKETAVLKGHSDSVCAVAFSPDGQTIASSSRDKTVKFWRITPSRETGFLRRTLADHTDIVFGLAFSSDSKMLAVAARDGTVKLWDTFSYEELVTLRTDSGTYAVAFSPNNAILATGHSDKSVNLWSVSPTQKMVLPHFGSVTSVAFSTDKVFGIGLRNGVVELWDITGQLLRTLKPEPSTLMRGSDDNTPIVFSSDGKLLAAANSNAAVSLWGATKNELIALLKSNDKQYSSERITSLAFSKDGRVLATLDDAGIVELWDTNTCKKLRTFEQNGCDITSIAFSINSKLLAVSDCRGIILWDIATFRKTVNLMAEGYVNSMTFSPDGTMLATGDDVGNVELWDNTTHKKITSFKAHAESVNCIAFSPDSKTLATGGNDKTVKLWDTKAHQELIRLNLSSSENEGPISSVAFSPNGEVLVFSNERMVTLWYATADRDMIVRAK